MLLTRDEVYSFASGSHIRPTSSNTWKGTYQEIIITCDNTGDDLTFV